MLFIVGICISIFLVLLLWMKRPKSKADKILLAWLSLVAIHQSLNYFLYTGEAYNYPHWLGVQFWMPVLHGVLLYFYVMEITGNKLNNKWAIPLHLIPTLSVILLAIPFYILSGAEKIKVFQNDGVDYEWFTTYISILIPLSGLIYSIWSLFLIKKHRINIQNRFSNTDKKELQWLAVLSLGYAIIWVLSIFFENEIIFTAVVIMVLFMGFFGINQLNIFNTQQEVFIDKGSDSEKFGKNKQTKANPSQKRYAKSGLSEAMANSIYIKLGDLVQTGAIYKNENLTLSELARLLKVHPNHLSQVINEREGTNFYNFINSLRIKEFIQLVSNPDNNKYTLISLAYDCGFGTKSTFNKHFKSYTGKTPSDYFSSERK